MAPSSPPSRPGLEPAPLPTLFVSHGAPSFALATEGSAAVLRALGRQLPRPRAVLVISAHWLTAALQVTGHPQPPQLHDFLGFPDALYALSYLPPGSPTLAKRIVELLTAAGLEASSHPGRGLDHGSWVPLLHLYPDADVPVLQLSLPASATPLELVAIGRGLEPLRREGVLIIGSGGITHNLADLRPDGSAPADYAEGFIGWVADAIRRGDLDALVAYRHRAPDAVRAHPTEEHLLPLFVSIGGAGEDWASAIRLPGGVSYGVVGMDGYLFGATGSAGSTTSSARAEVV